MGRIEKLANFVKDYQRFRHFKNEVTTQENIYSALDWFNLFGNSNNTQDISEITYFTCLKVLSETLGKLTIHLKDNENNIINNHKSLKVLRYRTNENCNPSNFKTLMEYNRNHYGNAYAYILHDKKGNLAGLYPLEPYKVKIWIDEAGIINKKQIYEYTNKDKVYRFNSEDILHVKGLTQNGITGMCIREILANSLKGNKESQKILNELYERGLTSKAILKYTGDLSEKSKKELQSKIVDLANNENGAVLPIPLGMDLVPLDIKLTDSQFFELKKYSALQIASAFGIKPNQLNDYEKSSYANSEMQNLTFYIDTLLYILTIYEEELNYKLLTEEERQKGYSYEFNVAKILRGDLKTQAEAITTYTSNSIYTINEARKYAGMPKVDGGDILIVNGSYTDIENIGQAYKGNNTEKEV